MYQIGIDVGSTYVKYCVRAVGMDANEPIKFWNEPTPIRQKEYFRGKMDQLSKQYGESRVISCGYGKKNIGNRYMISELTALAIGAGIQCPAIHYILDIGGQDTKLICQEEGKLKFFFVNDKCAAGCGLFLEHVLHMLQMRFDEINLDLYHGNDIHLSSVCAVFAQSEIVELISNGVSSTDIIYAVIRQILIQARILLGKADCKALVLSGGLALIPGIQRLAEEIMEVHVLIPGNANYLSALGCAYCV